jgi:hypothetical protein
MAQIFSLSPSVVVREFDFSTYIPSVDTTSGAVAGVFNWGPVEDRTLISSEDELVFRFGPPTQSNFETWFTALNFLSYGGQGGGLWVSRAANNAKNAIAGPTYTNATSSNTTVKNLGDFNSQGTAVANSGSTYYLAKFPGSTGSTLKISVCDSANAYNTTLANTTANDSVTFSFTTGSNTANVVVVNSANNVTLANTSANNILAAISVGDYIKAGNTSVGYQFLKVSGKTVTSAVNSSAVSASINVSTIFTMSSNVSQTTLDRYWEFYSLVDRAPGTSNFVADRGGAGDELHVVVVDEDGILTGTPGEVVEVFKNLSRATDSEREDGGTDYYATIINHDSKFIYWAYDRAGSVSNTAVNMTALNTAPLNLSFWGGADGDDESTISPAALTRAYDQFKSAEDVDIALVMAGKARGGVLDTLMANYIIDNIVEFRKDCVAFVSPRREAVVNNFLSPEEDVVLFRNQLRSTSYAVLDSGYKYQYDRYNNVYRWVPLNGDIAGLCVRTDMDRDPWWSPAGFNRGQIKNVVQLAFNPNKIKRDYLYKNGVNPVVAFPGEGTILFGDRTLLTKPSAFDRINVRRLFIVMEKAIATAAKYLLFEFNDEFTRATFRNMVEPYLRDIQGRRGIYAFKVRCDATNNTPEVIDSNQFVGDILVQPAKSINVIVLNFVATRTGVDFSEIPARL